MCPVDGAVIVGMEAEELGSVRSPCSSEHIIVCDVAGHFLVADQIPSEFPQPEYSLKIIEPFAAVPELNVP